MKLFKNVKRQVLFIVFSYGFIAGTWIIFSDKLLGIIFQTPEFLLKWSIIKGLIYVLITSLLLYMLISRMVQKLQKKEIELRKALEEKETLLHELNHRINNNLQMISNLVSLQTRYAGSKKTTDILNESLNRIRSIALVHEKLYLTKGISNINLKEYISDLVNNLFIVLKGKERGIQLELNIEEVHLNIERAITCGLIINEVVTNSIMHAFPQDQKSVIVVSLKNISEGKVELTIKDNGVGFPKGFDSMNAESLGLKLIYGMAKNQLDASIDVIDGQGTCFCIVFPNLPIELAGAGEKI